MGFIGSRLSEDVDLFCFEVKPRDLWRSTNPDTSISRLQDMCQCPDMYPGESPVVQAQLGESPRKGLNGKTRGVF